MKEFLFSITLWQFINNKRIEDIMRTMFRQILAWLIVFGLSFLVRNLGWTEQGKAFLIIHITLTLLITLILFVYYGCTIDWRLSIYLLSVIILFTALTLLACWGATKLFSVDFFAAYQIMSFGQCLTYIKSDDKD